MRKFVSLLAVLTALALFGCGNPQAKLQAAKEAESSGDHSKAANLYAALALELSPGQRLTESHRGKVLQAPVWIAEVDKYMKWLTESASPRDNAFFEAVNGLARCTERLEPENTANTSAPRPLDSLSVFAREWNQAFHPPASGGPDEWNAVIRRAHEQKYSILRFASPQNYVYDFSVISRKNSRRVHFTLYSDSKVTIALPPGDYWIILRSTVQYQKGSAWYSDYSVLDVNMANSPTLTTMDMRTRVRVAKKE